MNAIFYEFPENTNWRELYRAAVIEPDSIRTPQHIANARRAIVLRARELFHKNAGSREEKQALDGAMCCLHALDNALKHRGINPQSIGGYHHLKAG